MTRQESIRFQNTEKMNKICETYRDVPSLTDGVVRSDTDYFSLCFKEANVDCDLALCV